MLLGVNQDLIRNCSIYASSLLLIRVIQTFQ
jgi:hypothetical protein